MRKREINNLVKRAKAFHNKEITYCGYRCRILSDDAAKGVSIVAMEEIPETKMRYATAIGEPVECIVHCTDAYWEYLKTFVATMEADKVPSEEVAGGALHGLFTSDLVRIRLSGHESLEGMCAYAQR